MQTQHTEFNLAKKIENRFPIGTLVQATIPRMNMQPHVLLGLVISHILQIREEKCCEVFFGPNLWSNQRHTVIVRVGRLKSISRTYTKGRQ